MIGNVVLLFGLLKKGESEGDGRAFVRYMDFVPSLDKRDEALRCVCLQWATAGCAEEKSKKGETVKERYPVVAGDWFEAIVSRTIVTTALVV